MRACPYPVAVTVPSSETAATCELSEANVTPVAGPITVPVSSAKLARSAYRLLSGRPTRVADSLRPATSTRICHVAASPEPGPLAVKLVFPAFFPVQRPRAGAQTASEVRSEEHTSELQSRPHLVC